MQHYIGVYLRGQDSSRKSISAHGYINVPCILCHMNSQNGLLMCANWSNTDYATVPKDTWRLPYKRNNYLNMISIL